MGIWDELIAPATRVGARSRGGKSVSKKPVRMAISNELAEKLAPEETFWSRAGSEIGSFFKPAGVLGKNIADLAYDPVGSLTEGKQEGLTNYLRGMKKAQEYTDKAKKYLPLNYVPGFAPGDVNDIAKGFSKAGQAWDWVTKGVNPGDGDPNAVWGDRTKQRWADIQESVDAVASKNKTKPFMQRMTEGTAAEHYFNPDSPDVMSAALDAGLTPAESFAVSLMNPLEWIGAESKAGLAAKLSNAGKARKALNAVGKFMDPTQMALDAAGSGLSKAAKAAKGIDWRLPGRAASAAGKAVSKEMPVDELIRRSRDPEGVMESLRRIRREEGLPEEWTPAESAKPGNEGVDPWDVFDTVEAPQGPRAWDAKVDAPRSQVDEAIAQSLVAMPNPIRPKPDQPIIVRFAKARPRVDDSIEEVVRLADGTPVTLPKSELSPRASMVESVPTDIWDEIENFSTPKPTPSVDIPHAGNEDLKMIGFTESSPIELPPSPARIARMEAEQAAAATPPSLRSNYYLPEPEPPVVRPIGDLPRVDLRPGSNEPSPRYIPHSSSPWDDFDSIPSGPPDAASVPFAKPKDVSSITSVPGKLQPESPPPFLTRAESAARGRIADAITRPPGISEADAMIGRLYSRADILPEIPSVRNITKSETEQYIERLAGMEDIWDAVTRTADEGIQEVKAGNAFDAGDASVARVAGPEALPDAGRSPVGMVGDLPASGMADQGLNPVKEALDSVAPPLVRPEVRGLKLYSNPFFDPSVYTQANRWLADSMSRLQSRVDAAIGRVVARVVAGSPTLQGLKKSVNDWLSTGYGKTDRVLLDELQNFWMQRHAITRTSVETVHEALRSENLAERAAMSKYMNGSLPRAQAAQVLSPAKLDSADAIRAMMDNSTGEYIAEALGIEKAFLMKASKEEKHLIKQIYETTGNRQTNIGKGRRPKTKTRLRPKRRTEKSWPRVTSRPSATSSVRRSGVNLNRQQVLANAAGTHSQAFIDRARTMIDDAMQRAAAEGLVRDGRLVDLDLPIGAWIENLGKYEPQLYKAIQYGVNLSNPEWAREFVDALDARHASVAQALGVPPKPIPEDFKRFITEYFSGGGKWNRAAAEEAGRFMKRKDLSQEMRDVLGPIINPAYNYAKGIEHVNLMTNTMKLRRWVAKEERLVSRAGESLDDFMKRTGTKHHEIAHAFTNDPQYAAQVGPLAGRYVHRDVADLLAITGAVPHLHAPDFIDKFKQLSRMWVTYSKVILNPTSHAKQYVQNGITVWNKAGVEAAKDYVNAFRDVKSRSRDYLEARDAGLLSAGHDEALYDAINLEEIPEYTMDGVDLMATKMARGSEVLSAVVDNMMKAKKGLKRVAKGAGDAFSISDDMAKIAMFKHYRRQGLQPKEAAIKAYQDVYTGTDHSRLSRIQAGLSYRATMWDRGASNPMLHGAIEMGGAFVMQPFFGAKKFMWDMAGKSLLGVASDKWMMLTDPAKAVRTYSMMLGIWGLNEMSKYVDGVSTEEESKQRADFMRPILPSQVRLPNSMNQLISQDGTNSWLDLSAFTPWGTAASGQYMRKRGRMSNLADNFVDTFVPGGWMLSKAIGVGDANEMINPGLKPLLEIASNEDAFFGREIYPEVSSNLLRDRVRPITAHVVRSYLPPWVPNPVGLLKALEDAPDVVAHPDLPHLGGMIMTGLQGLAQDSGHQASKAISGLMNTTNEWLPRLVEGVGEARRITDYMGRQQYIGKVFADVLGFKIDTRKKDEVWKSQQRKIKTQLEKLSETHNNAIRNMSPEAKRREQKNYNELVKRIKNSKPTLRTYETIGDTLLNFFNGVSGPAFDAASQYRPAEGDKMDNIL